MKVFSRFQHTKRRRRVAVSSLGIVRQYEGRLLKRQIVYVAITVSQTVDRIPWRVILLYKIVFNAFGLSRAKDCREIERALADSFEGLRWNMLVVLHWQAFFFIF